MQAYMQTRTDAPSHRRKLTSALKLHLSRFYLSLVRHHRFQGCSHWRCADVCACVRVCARVCACVRVCEHARACVRSCVRTYTRVRACVRACVILILGSVRCCDVYAVL